MEGACLPCLAIKTLSGERSLLIWGGSVCCIILGLPVNLWTKGTVGRQFVLSVHCVKFVPVKSSVSKLSRNVLSSDKYMSESKSSTSSVKSRSVMFSP